MVAFLAPVGTPPSTRVTATNGWQEIGTVESITYEQETTTLHSWQDSPVIRPASRAVHIQLEGGQSIYAPSCTFKKVSDREFEIVLDTYSFPQRYMLGTDQEPSLPFISNPSRTYVNGRGEFIKLGTTGYQPELSVAGGRSTILKSEDVPGFAYELFMNSSSLPRPKLNQPGGGQPYMSAGSATSAQMARVNVPQSEAEAQRNLNFAIANLAAYQNWERVGKPAQERQKEADLKRLEAEQRAKEEAKKREVEAKQAARNKAGLDLYNRVHGTRHMSWASSPFTLSLSVREEWADKAEEIAKLKRKGDPFRVMSDSINAATISANTISTQRLFGF